MIMEKNENVELLKKNLVSYLVFFKNDVRKLSLLFRKDDEYSMNIIEYITDKYPFENDPEDFYTDLEKWVDAITTKLKIVNKDTFSIGEYFDYVSMFSKENYLCEFKIVLSSLMLNIVIIRGLFNMILLHEGKEYLQRLISRLYPFEQSLEDLPNEIELWVNETIRKFPK